MSLPGHLPSAGERLRGVFRVSWPVRGSGNIPSGGQRGPFRPVTIGACRLYFCASKSRLLELEAAQAYVHVFVTSFLLEASKQEVNDIQGSLLAPLLTWAGLIPGLLSRARAWRGHPPCALQDVWPTSCRMGEDVDTGSSGVPSFQILLDPSSHANLSVPVTLQGPSQSVLFPAPSGQAVGELGGGFKDERARREWAVAEMPGAWDSHAGPGGDPTNGPHGQSVPQHSPHPRAA